VEQLHVFSEYKPLSYFFKCSNQSLCFLAQRRPTLLNLCFVNAIQRLYIASKPGLSLGLGVERWY